jgi:hypothetical protein
VLRGLKFAGGLVERRTAALGPWIDHPVPSRKFPQALIGWARKPYPPLQASCHGGSPGSRWAVRRAISTGQADVSVGL